MLTFETTDKNSLVSLLGKYKWKSAKIYHGRYYVKVKEEL